MRVSLLFTLIFWSLIVIGQMPIVFNDLSIEGALSLAKEKNKNVFIDTYADWCIPCKKIEQELKRPEIASFFNQEYINIRINMDYSPNAQNYRNNYDIVFLPTLIILDPLGNIKYKTDKVIPGDELLAIAKKSMNSNIFFASDATEISRSPMSSNQPVRSGPEVIVHKLGAANQNPEIMMKEAYFRIELMDGSHRKAANKYLETQTDWSINKNLRFIYDFLYTTKSPEFVYFSKNLNQFKKEIGDYEVYQTLSFLVNDELKNGFPRPNYDETKSLYALIDSSSAEENTMQYFMERYIDECNLVGYKNIALKYIEKYKIENGEVFANLGQICMDGEVNKQELEVCINATKKALDLQKNIPHYYEQLSNLYLKKGDKKLAKKSLEKALEIAKMCNHDLGHYERLLAKL